MSFKLEFTDGDARAGVLKVRSGAIKTPFFMPVATFATGRGVGPQDYHAAGVQATISNAYLLSLRPGASVIKEMGGLNHFMGAKFATFTDSGGFQSSSEALFVKASRRGVHLKSPYDGSLTILTPKKLIELQEALGGDVAMVIDDMAPPHATEAQFRRALDNTHRWAKECKELHHDKEQLLFAIVQGGYSADLRKQSAEYLTSLGFDGYGVGGCAIGEPKVDMYRAIKNTTPHLPQDKVRYLMGVGSPPDVVQCVGMGIDCFDSIFPTRNARHNMIFTRNGSYQVEKARFANDKRPLEEGCGCYACTHHTRAYIRHLSSIDEAEGFRLRQIHNLHFMTRLMEECRKNIKAKTFSKFKKRFMEEWFRGKVPKLYQ